MEALALASDASKRITEDRRLAPKPPFEENGYVPSHRSARSTLASVAVSLVVIVVVAIALNVHD